MTPPERLQDVTLAERLRALHARLDAKLGAGFIDDIPGDELSAIREAAAALSVRGWQDIASAPKDGTFVLVTDARHPPCHLIARFKHNTWWGQQTQTGRAIVWREATHWQPLPEPPATPPSEG